MTLRRLSLLEATTAAFQIGLPGGPVPVIEVDDETGFIYAAEQSVGYDLKKVTVTVTPSQILALTGDGSNAITIVPAPGIGYATVVHEIIIYLQFATTAYSDGTDIGTYIKNSFDGSLGSSTVIVAATVLRNSLNFLGAARPAAATIAQNFIPGGHFNSPWVIDLDGGSVQYTRGDSPIIFTSYYRTISLT